MDKGKSGKQSSLRGKHGELLHHTGKYGLVAVRFPRSSARVSRIFDQPVVFLVPLSVAPFLHGSHELGPFKISGSRFIRMLLAGFVDDGLFRAQHESLSGLREMGASEDRLFDEIRHWNDLRIAMANLYKAIGRRAQAVNNQTEH